MATTGRNFFLGLLLILPLIFVAISAETDTINADQTLRDGETLVSSFGKYALGFFSPGDSKNRYVGIWFNNITETTIVWVANREAPVADNSGVFKLIHPGILLLLNATNATVWESNATTTTTVKSPVAQLLDSGNLVVRDSGDDSPENFLWQSFDYPTDTYLPGMKLGWDLVTGKEDYISSWKSNDDPARGEFSLHLDPTGYPQVVIKRGAQVKNRIGPWNGIGFPGAMNFLSGDLGFEITFVMDAHKIYYQSELIDSRSLSRYIINLNDVLQRYTWSSSHGWVNYFSIPADVCDTYKLCGAYESCNAESSPSCRCLDHRFVPWHREEWGSDSSGGCVRRTNLSCGGDVFVKYSGIKLPDARDSWHNSSMGLEECREECLRNCYCTAYTQLDVSNESGCLIWYKELVDIKTTSQDGQFIYIRVASSEAEIRGSKGKKRELSIASLVSVIGLVAVLVLSLSLYIWSRKSKNNHKMLSEEGIDNENPSDLPFWDLSIVTRATDHFSSDNKLGEGGFGPVYKGKLEGGQEIAVKRLSKESLQGLNELKNEVVFISKLQHRNLVKLLGCCIQGDESMLIYEFLPNKSLDLILFVDMSPEYAMGGLFSIKSDVFSFGVLVLEIVSGKRNRGFSSSEHSPNLLGHASKLYKEGRSAELVDTCLEGKFEYAEVEKSIKVGLLCVQQNPEDRPNMSSVVWMLGNEREISEAKQPGFFTQRDLVGAHNFTRRNSSINEVTITMPQPR